MKTKKIRLEKGEIIGFLIELNNAPLILLQAKKGYVMCGYLNISTANKLEDIAGKITGVKSFDDALNTNIIEVSENAKKIGLHAGMNVKDFLNMLF